VDPRAIEILGECLQFATRVGQRLGAILGDAKPAAIDLDVETFQTRRHASDRFVCFIQAL
jgi:hypothetical protein